MLKPGILLLVLSDLRDHDIPSLIGYGIKFSLSNFFKKKTTTTATLSISMWIWMLHFLLFLCYLFCLQIVLSNPKYQPYTCCEKTNI